MMQVQLSSELEMKGFVCASCLQENPEDKGRDGEWGKGRGILNVWGVRSKTIYPI